MTRPIGFTLVEVVLSMGLVAMAVLTIAALLPAMFKTQQIVRLQTYAATHAMTISNAVAQGNPRFPGFTAAVKPNSDVSTFALDRGHSFARMQLPGGAFSRPSFADVEQIITGNGQSLSNGQSGIPVPLEIARRIDSDQDEIRQLLSDGAYLFYPPPGNEGSNILAESVVNLNMGHKDLGKSETDADRQRLVFAVIGKPQQNLLPCHPCFNLPIYKLYPFPPEVRTFPMTWIYYTKGLGSELNKWPFGLSTVQTPNPRRIQDSNPKLEVIGPICNIWKYFKDQPQPSNSASFDGAWLKIWADTYADYLALCCYGWTPISFKLGAPPPNIEVYYGPEWPSIPGGSASAAPINAPGTELDFDKSPKNYDKYVQALKAGKVPFGSRMTEPSVLNISPAPERYYDPAQAHQLDPNDSTVVTTPTDTWYSLMAPFDPVDFPPYDGSVMPFKKGLGINADRYREPPGLPSLEMRRYYRRMALCLWMKTIGIDALSGYSGWTPGMSSNVFETGISSDKNPLISLIQPKLDLNLAPIQSKDDLCGGENWRYPHPARIYALTFLAHAAMLVTGARGPMIKADGGYDPYKLNGKIAEATDPMEIWDLTTANSLWGMNSATMAWWYCDLNQNHPGLGNATSPAVFDDPAAAILSANQKYFDGAELLQEDIQFARMAHENCMRWIMAYASENPNDLCCPRPANRQSFMDRPLWCADLFPATGGLANRGGSAAPYFTLDENYYRVMSDRESRLAPIFTGKVPVVSGKSASWDAFHRAIDPKWSLSGVDSQLGAVGSFHRSTDSGHDQKKPWLLNAADQADGVHFNRPFAASERCRELVFWSVDWMNYEDAESAPSAPFDASFLTNLLSTHSEYDKLLNGVFGDNFATPEILSQFSGPGRESTLRQRMQYNSLLTIFSENVETTGNKWFGGFGQFGADRNGNGKFDRGPVPASQRMRSTTIARFNLYDPVGPCGLRR